MHIDGAVALLRIMNTRQPKGRHPRLRMQILFSFSVVGNSFYPENFGILTKPQYIKCISRGEPVPPSMNHRKLTGKNVFLYSQDSENHVTEAFLTKLC